MPTIDIDPAEWKEAINYFAEDPDAVKLKRSDKLAHSFIKVEGEIYALAVHEYLGEGSFGKVKIAQARNGEQYAVKIEGGKNDEKSEASSELIIMRLLGRVKGTAKRPYTGSKLFKGAKISQKKITLMKLEEGDELLKSLYTIIKPKGEVRRLEKKPLKSKAERLMIAIKALESIQDLHQRGIIHNDIKPGNFMANFAGDQIVLTSIDFGAAVLLKEGEKIHQTNRYLGTPIYMAPETTSGKTGIYSFDSDKWSLGIMFQKDLDLDEDLYQGLLLKQPPEDRESLESVRGKLYHSLASTLKEESGEEFRLKEQAENMLSAYQKENSSFNKKVISIIETKISSLNSPQSKYSVKRIAFGKEKAKNQAILKSILAECQEQTKTGQKINFELAVENTKSKLKPEDKKEFSAMTSLTKSKLGSTRPFLELHEELSAVYKKNNVPMTIEVGARIKKDPISSLK